MIHENFCICSKDFIMKAKTSAPIARSVLGPICHLWCNDQVTSDAVCEALMQTTLFDEFNEIQSMQGLHLPVCSSVLWWSKLALYARLIWMQTSSVIRIVNVSVVVV